MNARFNRRSFLSTALGACGVARVASLSAQVTPPTGALTKERRDRMMPAQVIDELKKGN